MNKKEYDYKMGEFIGKTLTKDSLSKMFGVINMYQFSLESKITTYEFKMEAYRQCEVQLKNCETALDEALERIKELEAIKSCDGC